MKNWKKYSLVFVAIGIISFISISFLVHPQQNFAIAQNSPDGNGANKISKTIFVSNSSSVPISSTAGTASISNPTGIMYTTKFECGSIYAGEGPLRPGHYDTDVSIFNKQKFKTTMLWNAIVNNGSASNAILLNLNSESATAITCQDIRKVIGNYNGNFLEGFIVINVPLDSVLQSSKGSVIPTISGNDINLLEVQAFYTANALDVLPHEIIVDKISFYIIQDRSGKIPQDMLRKTLDISISSGLNEISDTEKKVKDALAKQYNLSDNDLPKIVVRIKSVSVGVGVLIDDHAISLSTVKPQLSSE
ncbi:MAG: hypothetical protein AUI61_00680 [Thaumarchaeota archaeon 13_1_40CM_2_39_13_2]|nr:MAG: hypothetical protein AUI61_00680 [Thaumarchaeota archaeon 13_1_40CM_2_39_13_2]OLE41022.1 MAG: hypothetical protein AUG16_01695 [Thaumarchaeota archaeon 13_1_20CM_2_39_20]